MSGTTLCTHCDTRFKITEAQLEAREGMVRCGHCLKAFDARPGFIPDQPSPQLELPMLNEPVPSPESGGELPAAVATRDEAGDDFTGPEPGVDGFMHVAINLDEDVPGKDEPVDAAHYEMLDYAETTGTAQNETMSEASLPPGIKSLHSMTLAEQVAIVQDEDDSELRPARRTWPWAIAALLLLLMLTAQAAYFFRVDLAAHLPGTKSALISYCQLLNCTVPLPQNADLMSIESSDLEADPAHENRITLNALLRNRASYSQAFPNLELTLNDMQDRALARRVFLPADYLPPLESEIFGLLPQHEISIRLPLEVTDLRPTGYRLALLYPRP